MEKKEIEIGSPLTIGDVSIIPVVELSMTCRCYKKLVSSFGSKRPVGVVVVTPSQKKVFWPSGEEVTLEQLMQEFPTLREKVL